MPPTGLVPLRVQDGFEGEDYSLADIPGSARDRLRPEGEDVFAQGPYSCNHVWRGWRCTREEGHRGDHMGGTSGRRMVARWWPENPWKDLEVGPWDGEVR